MLIYLTRWRTLRGFNSCDGALGYGHLVKQPLEAIEKIYRGIRREILGMAVKDLLAFPDDKPIVAEVFGGGGVPLITVN